MIKSTIKAREQLCVVYNIYLDGSVQMGYGPETKLNLFYGNYLTTSDIEYTEIQAIEEYKYNVMWSTFEIINL